MTALQVFETIFTTIPATFTVIDDYDNSRTECKSAKGMFDEIHAIEESYIEVKLNDSDVIGHIYPMAGNDDEEIISDYSTNLSLYLDPII